MKITLELFDDCIDFDGSLDTGLNCLAWNIVIDGTKVGELENYENICKKLNIIFEIEDAGFEIKSKNNIDKDKCI